jgi:hypothetical protein
MNVPGLLHSRPAWVAAGFLAVAGIVAYLVIGDSAGWYLGLAAVAPLAGLMIWRLAEDDDGYTAPGGDGPWGAP